MIKGSFDDFRDALRAFESGWDRVRYETSDIRDWQLDQWARGTVDEYFPEYTSWSQLTDSEWEVMSYRSMNTLGFVGYQFGEALLIDLGYYDDDLFYGNGAASNTWDGTWTGKNGVTSLEDFMTKEAQEVAIQEAFGFNLKIIQEGLANQGQNLADYIGTTRSYMENGQEVEVSLTLTGIMAAAHLRGAYGTLNLLLSGSVSADEFGTSILRYVKQFGGYDAPSIEDAIAYFTSRTTGDEGLGGPGSGGGVVDNGTDNGATKEDADVVITWSWGQDAVKTDFDPATDSIFIDWISADQLSISEVNGSAVFAVPSNNQSLTLQGVALADLARENFTILDASAAAKISELVGKSDGAGDGSNGGDGGHGHGDGHGGGDPAQMVMIGLDSASREITDFDPDRDMVHLLEGVTGDRFQISKQMADGSPSVRIVVSDQNGAPLSVTILRGVDIGDLSLSNFSVAEQTAFNEVVTAINATVTPPPANGGGFDFAYDSDGSNPAQTTGSTAKGGVKYKADVNADDILNFDPAKDEIDFGNNSVHAMILTKLPSGEVAIDTPWSSAIQILQGVTYQDLSLQNFGIVGNEHLRQDVGGVLSWELGIGPRENDTVYIRSHEYGRHETIDDFDPAAMKISFLYFGTREQLSVEETPEGLVIQTLPGGQSYTFTDLKLGDLSPGNLEFHFDQVMEDNLEVPFGFDQEDVTLVDRTALLTPQAPVGHTTDGFQTRDGVNAPGGGDTDGGGGDGGGGDGSSGGTPPDSSGRVELTWNWAVREVIEGFNPDDDVLDFGHLAADQLQITEEDGDLMIEILNNGGHNYRIQDVQAEDLTIDNLEAAPYNDVVDSSGGVRDQLIRLGFDDLII